MRSQSYQSSRVSIRVLVRIGTFFSRFRFAKAVWNKYIGREHCKGDGYVQIDVQRRANVYVNINRKDRYVLEKKLFC